MYKLTEVHTDAFAPALPTLVTLNAKFLKSSKLTARFKARKDKGAEERIWSLDSGSEPPKAAEALVTVTMLCKAVT